MGPRSGNIKVMLELHTNRFIEIRGDSSQVREDRDANSGRADTENALRSRQAEPVGARMEADASSCRLLKQNGHCDFND